MPKPGDYFMVTSGVLHAVGRYGCGAAVLLGEPRSGMMNLDICLMNVHLPQMYRPDECQPLAQVRLRDHGFCPTCRGWGLTSMYDRATMDQVLDGQHGAVCSRCGGSGRAGVKVTIIRNVDSTESHVDVDDSMPPLACELCRSATSPTQ